MFSSRLFWRIFAAYCVLTLVLAGVFVWILVARVESIMVAKAEDRLHDSAVVLRKYLPPKLAGGTGTALQDSLRELAAENGTRITVIAKDGTVIGDSENDAETMENHGSRPEVLEARENGFGFARRTSQETGAPMMYCAVRTDDDSSPIGFVRVAVDMNSTNAHLDTVRNLIWISAAVLAVSALVLTYVIVGRIIRPLTALTEAARAVSEGHLEQHVTVSNRDELGMLADAFNAMSAKLASRIETLVSTQAQLQEKTDLLQTVFATMIEGVVAIDERQVVLFANEAGCRLLDSPTPHVVGRPIWEVARHTNIQDVVREVLGGASQQRAEFEIARTGCWVNVLASYLSAETSGRVVLVLHDITELRRLETIRRDFVSNVSHELKTPLTAIKACAETLVDGAINDPEHSHRFVKQIEEQAERLHALILDLLSLARIESQERTFDIRSLPVAELIAACVAEHSTIAESKQVHLTSERIDAGLQILADRNEMRTLLGNLVENAINYTPAGGHVALSCRREDGWARIDVADTGIGIPKRHQSRIFERFYRVDRARSREVAGTGLGLAIVKHLVQAFGGRIEVASEPGKGSTFSVFLPLSEPSP